MKLKIALLALVSLSTTLALLLLVLSNLNLNKPAGKLNVVPQPQTSQNPNSANLENDDDGIIRISELLSPDNTKTAILALGYDDSCSLKIKSQKNEELLKLENLTCVINPVSENLELSGLLKLENNYVVVENEKGKVTTYFFDETTNKPYMYQANMLELVDTNGELYVVKNVTDDSEFIIASLAKKELAKVAVEGEFFSTYFDEINNAIFFVSRIYTSGDNPEKKDYSQVIIKEFNTKTYLAGTLVKTTPVFTAGRGCEKERLIPIKGYFVLGTQNAPCLNFDKKYKDENGNIVIKL